MAFIWHDEGEEWLLKVAFSEQASVPANFYVGVCHDTLVEADGLADILGEPSGHGYARQAVASDNVDIVVAVAAPGWKATMKQVTFTASGGDWGDIDTWFVATSADNSLKLLASGPVDPERTINDGMSLLISAYLSNQ